MTIWRKSYNSIMMANCDLIFLPDLGFYGDHLQAKHEFPIINLETFYFTEEHLGICQTSMCSTLCFIKHLCVSGWGFKKLPVPAKSYPKTFWFLVLTLLPHWCKISSLYLMPVPNYWTKTTPQKSAFSGQILIKLRLW